MAGSGGASRPARLSDASLIEAGGQFAGLRLAVLAAGGPLAIWITFTALGRAPAFNDFHSYWLAGRLLLNGQSPYDLEAMRALGRAEGLQFVLGTGYSYPLPFAFAMIPFSLLPFLPAVLLFNTISLVGFGWLVGWWLTRHHPGASSRRLAAAAALAGLFPPVYGTIDNGQANLVVLVPLALGLGLIVGDHRRDRIGGALLGLAAVVKIVPAAVVIPLLIARRWSADVALVGAAVAVIVIASFLAPAAQGAAWLSRLIEPDPYFTNQSLNGFVSRLVLESGRTLPLAMKAFDPAPVATAAALALGLVTLLVLLQSLRISSTFPTLALGLALALVAATIGAPKNSFWNQALALPALGLMLAVEAPDLALGRFGLLDRCLLLAFWVGSGIEFVIWIEPLPKLGPLSAMTTLAQSAALYGTLALWCLLVRRLRMTASRGEPPGGARSSGDEATV